MDTMVRWLQAIQWLLALAMFVAAGVVWPFAADRIPIHWGFSGQADAYGGKLQGLLLLPLTALLLALLLRYLPRLDPFRANYAEFADAYAVVSLGIVVLLAVIFAMVVAAAFGARVNVGLVIGPTVGALLVLIGAVLGKVRRNWFFGIRTPWTLSSERSWTATHRAGRWVFIVAGLAIAVAGLIQAPTTFWITISLCVLGVLEL